MEASLEARSVLGPPSDRIAPKQDDNLGNLIDRMKISADDPRAKLRSWLGKILKIVISDDRIIVGCFVCTDREGNVILENSLEYAQIIGASLSIQDNNEPKMLGLALIPGKHIVSVGLMKH